MSDIQVDEFRSRVNRIVSGDRKTATKPYYDAFGNLVIPKIRKKTSWRMSMLRTMVLLYLVFTVFKAVMIHNSDGHEYSQILANLEAGDTKSQFIASAMAPGYFAKPVGEMVSNLANHLENVRIK
jgi:hypothetical protein